MEMRKLTMFAMAALVSVIMAACGGDCPECNCPVCPSTQVATPTPTPVGPCTEEWVHMPVLINFPTGGAELDARMI